MAMNILLATFKVHILCFTKDNDTKRWKDGQNKFSWIFFFKIPHVFGSMARFGWHNSLTFLFEFPFFCIMSNKIQAIARGEKSAKKGFTPHCNFFSEDHQHNSLCALFSTTKQNLILQQVDHIWEIIERTLLAKKQQLAIQYFVD